MSEKYKITTDDKPFFVTITTIGWIDIFTRKEIKQIIVGSLKYCQENKGLIIYGWCIMSSHLHLICQACNGKNLSDILRDFKTFTSKAIVKFIKEGPESRKEWLLELFSKACEHLSGGQEFKVWQDGNHPKIIYTPSFFWEKLNYIHNNPVEEMIVEKPEDYLFSSARSYTDRHGLLDIVMETRRLKSF
jgi:REP element-mobilizing transposase RayT